MTPKNEEQKPVDTLDLDTAVQLAESLHGIKNAPQRPGALQATVQDLRAWCTGVGERTDGGIGWVWTATMQAEWLVAEARREWDEWQGPRALQAIFDQKFRPALKPFGDAPSKPPAECFMCGDSGVRDARESVLGGQPIWVWCECRHGSEMQALSPTYLDLLNKRGALQEAARRVPVPTAEEIEALKQKQNANRKESKQPL